MAPALKDDLSLCPRCGHDHCVLTDKSGLDRVLALYYHEHGFGLIEACMCADPRQLSVFWGNTLKKIKGIGKTKQYLACPDCAFWQVMP